VAQVRKVARLSRQHLKPLIGRLQRPAAAATAEELAWLRRARRVLPPFVAEFRATVHELRGRVRRQHNRSLLDTSGRFAPAFNLSRAAGNVNYAARAGGCSGGGGVSAPTGAGHARLACRRRWAAVLRPCQSQPLPAPPLHACGAGQAPPGVCAALVSAEFSVPRAATPGAERSWFCCAHACDKQCARLFWFPSLPTLCPHLLLPAVTAPPQRARRLRHRCSSLGPRFVPPQKLAGMHGTGLAARAPVRSRPLDRELSPLGERVYWVCCAGAGRAGCQLLPIFAVSSPAPQGLGRHLL